MRPFGQILWYLLVFLYIFNLLALDGLHTQKSVKIHVQSRSDDTISVTSLPLQVVLLCLRFEPDEATNMVNVCEC